MFSNQSESHDLTQTWKGQEPIMQDIAFYAGALLGALVLAVIIEAVIEWITRLRKRKLRYKPLPFFNRDRLIRILFVTALFFFMSVFGSRK